MAELCPHAGMDQKRTIKAAEELPLPPAGWTSKRWAIYSTVPLPHARMDHLKDLGPLSSRLCRMRGMDLQPIPVA